jgi:hypothetical protein
VLMGSGVSRVVWIGCWVREAFASNHFCLIRSRRTDKGRYVRVYGGLLLKRRRWHRNGWWWWIRVLLLSIRGGCVCCTWGEGRVWTHRNAAVVVRAVRRDVARHRRRPVLTVPRLHEGWRWHRRRRGIAGHTIVTFRYPCRRHTTRRRRSRVRTSHWLLLRRRRRQSVARRGRRRWCLRKPRQLRRHGSRLVRFDCGRMMMRRVRVA